MAVVRHLGFFYKFEISTAGPVRRANFVIMPNVVPIRSFHFITGMRTLALH